MHRQERTHAGTAGEMLDGADTPGGSTLWASLPGVVLSFMGILLEVIEEEVDIGSSPLLIGPSTMKETRMTQDLARQVPTRKVLLNFSLRTSFLLHDPLPRLIQPKSSSARVP